MLHNHFAICNISFPIPALNCQMFALNFNTVSSTDCVAKGIYSRATHCIMQIYSN